MTKLHIDIETFSILPFGRNPKSVGLYKYAANCELMLFAYAYDDGPVKLVDLTRGEHIPEQVLADLEDANIIKTAYNAPFEIACLSACLWLDLDPAQWRCGMGLCFMAGITVDLDKAGQILGIKNLKDKIGNTLIPFFCSPCKPTKSYPYTRRLPADFPEKWELFRGYCPQDVRAEREIEEALLPVIRLTPFERSIWAINEAVNNRGIRIDVPFVKAALALNTTFREKVLKEAYEITGLENPNSLPQLKAWLENETDEIIDNLKKENIPALLERFDSLTVKRVLEIKGELSKTSVKKYDGMLRQHTSDGRIKGMHQYCGAGRTWRFAGRGLQVHNFVKGVYKGADLDRARLLVYEGNYDMLEALYGVIPDTLSQLLRTALIPAEGKQFYISDFKAVEAVILAWLANETWQLEVFKTDGKIYEATAARILKKPIADITQKERNETGKISQLALGYGGSVGALLNMAAQQIPAVILEEHKIMPTVKGWRRENVNIVNLWYAMNGAAVKAINTGVKVSISDIHRNGEKLIPDSKGVSFEMRRGFLVMNLPSGHALYYKDASLIPGKYGVQIQYYGLDGVSHKWGKIRTYGGKLVENFCQATGRDLLVNGLKNLSDACIETVLHVHDETVSECDVFESIEYINELMCKLPKWAEGLPLKADGFISDYYKK